MVTPLTLLYPVITRSTSASRTGLEGDQVQLAQHTLGDPGVIGPALRLGVVAHEVLDRRGRPGLVQAADERAGHPGDQHRVLAERLEAPAAERRAHDVDRRAQQDVDALAPGLGAERSGERLDQGGIPGGLSGDLSQGQMSPLLRERDTRRIALPARASAPPTDRRRAIPGRTGLARPSGTTSRSNLARTRYRLRNNREIPLKLAHGTHALQVYGAAMVEPASKFDPRRPDCPMEA